MRKYKRQPTTLIVNGDTTTMVCVCTRGKFKGEINEVIFDTADLDIVLACERPWYVYRYGKMQEKYCASSVGHTPARTVLLHRMLMKPPKGKVVDHKDGNGLNCRRSNMQNITHQENVSKSKLGDKPHMQNKATGVRNVVIHRNMYQVRVRNKYYGCYKTLKEAAKVAKQQRDRLNYERWQKYQPDAVEPKVIPYQPRTYRKTFTDAERLEKQREWVRKYRKSPKGKAAAARAYELRKDKLKAA